MRVCVSLGNLSQGGRSVGDGGGGRVPPLFSGGGDSIGIVPHFSAQKNCEAYSLTHHSSLLKAATQD